MPGPPVNRAPRSFSSAGSDSLDDCVHKTVGSAARTERTALAVRAVLEGRRRGASMLLPFAGPAVVVSVAYMDPANLATNIQAGGRAGDAFLLGGVVGDDRGGVCFFA